MLGNEDSWELGYSMLTQYHGKGLMSEALAAAVDYGFNTMNLQVIHAHTHKDNIASIRLLEKAKFTRNTTLEAALPEEEINILVVYSLYKG
jgi:ribosomal-protein-alanine N-acetyltransferase